MPVIAATLTAQVPRGRPLLLHPVALAALVALILNDHWLKAAGLMPGWFTGKLSDFAGLIVAPIVLIELAAVAKLRGSSFQHALIATSAVGVLFTLIKTLPSANALYVRLSGALLSPLGWNAGAVLDVTDLIALTALAVPLWLARRQMPPGPNLK